MPLSQRVKKQVGNDTTYFSYDEQGKLIGEYDKDGKLIREYIYLGNQPIGFFTQEKSGELLQIHTDHLGTPRAVSNSKKEILWRWEGDQFGDVAPYDDLIKLPIRHAGQYADTETGLFYNYHRYYDPSMGRYISSDPLGLYDGTNPYNYVGASPLSYLDPLGLATQSGTGGFDFGNAKNICIAMASRGVRGVLGALSSSNISKCQDLPQPKECKDDDDDNDKCKEIEKKIDAVIKRLRRGIRNELKNKGKKGGSAGHFQNFNDTKTHLKKLIAEAIANGCYVDPLAYEMLEKQYPWQPPQ